MNALSSIMLQLERARRRYQFSRVVLALLRTAGMLLILLLLFVLADNAFRTMSFVPRSFMLLFFLLALAVLGRIGFVLFSKVSDDFIARVLERALTGSENRLINAVQLGRTPKNIAVAEEILTESSLLPDALASARLVSPGLFKKAFFLLATALFAFLLATAIMPGRVAHSLQRLSSPVRPPAPYSITRITAVVPGAAQVAKGSKLEVAAEFDGVPPKKAWVEWRRGHGDPVRTIMTADAGSAATLFTVVSPPIYAPTKYRVFGNDAISQWYDVDVLEAPTLESWSLTVTPPDYTRIPSFILDAENLAPAIPVGSTVRVSVRASQQLRSMRALVGGDEWLQADFDHPRQEVAAIAVIGRSAGSMQLELTGANGISAVETLPLSIDSDSPPTVKWMIENLQMQVEANATLALPFHAQDDYGIGRVELERLELEDGGRRVLDRNAPEGSSAPRNQVDDSFVLDVGTLKLTPGETAVLRLVVFDVAPAPQSGFSSQLHLTVVEAGAAREQQARREESVKNSLQALIERQRRNYVLTTNVQDSVLAGRGASLNTIRNARSHQAAILAAANALLRAKIEIGGLRDVLLNLADAEMPEAVAVFDGVLNNFKNPDLLQSGLVEETQLQQTILARLTVLARNFDAEMAYQRKVDIMRQLREMIEDQGENFKATKLLDTATADTRTVGECVKAQDHIAMNFNSFMENGWLVRETADDDKFAAALTAVMNLFKTEKTYLQLITAAETLDSREFDVSRQAQGKALNAMKKGLNMLNAWSVENALAKLEKAKEALSKTRESLEKMEDDQTRILETTQELAKRGRLDDETREQLAAMDRDQEKMKELVEELANDLYQFPELPVCNELNSKMNEIFEDVEQAANSENEPAIEIAVQKEDSLLDAIRNAKERVEDVEMWMPDVPDNIAWNMESFDADEFPDMPLVPLPDELEDIVGELLEQAAEIDAQSQDSTGNNMMADAEMGWDIMDGPMPNFSAKGKSGNARPNDNEMTGRSGAGREGQSSGELVEGVSKGLEGREPHARRTRDALQSGLVEEDENSTLDAKATGGGKLGGVSESIGMFGNAPRRDQAMPDHGDDVSALRRETEALYTAARMLYLPTGSLGSAASAMTSLEQPPPEMSDFDSLHKKALRRLEETKTELTTGVTLSMPSQNFEANGGRTAAEIDINQVDEQYRGIVSDYFSDM